MMSFKDFSAALITTGDLDPDYLVLKEHAADTNMTSEDLFRWIILKVFVYDTASEMSIMYFNKDFDEVVYGAERRKNKRNTVKQMNDVINKFDASILAGGIHYRDFKKYVTQFPGIGPWAAWKMADLLERVMEININFTVDFREAYEFPLKGLLRVNGYTDDDMPMLKEGQAYARMMDAAIKSLGPVWSYEAPCGRRTLNLQELETCLCKYHSHLGGHYNVGQDTRHLMHRMKAEGHKMPSNVEAHFKRYQQQMLF